MANREMVTYKLEVFLKGVKVWERESFSPFEDIQVRIDAKRDVNSGSDSQTQKE